MLVNAKSFLKFSIVQKVFSLLGVSIAARSSLIYIIGLLATNALSFVRVPLVTRIVSPDSYGLFSSILAISGLATGLAALGTPGAIARQIIDSDGRPQEYITAAFFLVFGFVFSAASVTAVVLLFTGTTTVILGAIAFVLLDAALGFVFNVASHIWQIRQQAGRYSLVNVGFGVTTLAGTALLLIYGNISHVFSLMLAISISRLVFAIISLPTILKVGFRIPTAEDYRGMLGFSLPLIPHFVTMSIIIYSDRWMLQWFHGASLVGVYSAAYNAASAMGAILFGVATAFAPAFLHSIRDGEISNLKESFRFYSRIGWSLTLVAASSLPLAAHALLGSEFRSGIFLIPLVVAAFFFHFFYHPYTSYLYWYKNTKSIALNSIIASTTNVVGNFLFVPRFGMVAAAVTTVVAYLLLFVLNYMSAKKTELRGMFLSMRLQENGHLLIVPAACALIAFFLTLEGAQTVPVSTGLALIGVAVVIVALRVSDASRNVSGRLG